MVSETKIGFWAENSLDKPESTFDSKSLLTVWSKYQQDWTCTIKNTCGSRKQDIIKYKDSIKKKLYITIFFVQ